MIVENHALWGEEPTEDYPATFTYLGAEPLPDKPNGRRPAVIICGGGAFTHIAPHEQDPVAFAFLDHGYQAFVLNYVTSSTGDVSFPHPQADLAKMVATVRANADEWHVDPKRVCVVGFSAGGMICASLATQWKTGPFAALAGARPDDIRPDAVVLGYPLLDFAYVRDMQTRDPRIDLRVPKTGGKTATIKSHHNLIPFPEGVHFDLIEPLDHFFKDEVRALGLALGLPGHIVFRQPFPGPGLAIRIIGAVDKEKLEILKNADAIVREELDAYNQRLFEQTGERNSEHSCWQYFAVLPDIKSVGVMGDERTYQRPIILRAVESSDAMTADWAKLPYDVLARISGRIVAEVPGANRVCYDITSKPPATIEWE